MRIYAFTDLHGNLKALDEVKRTVRKQKPDLVVCLGDLTVFENELGPLLSRINMLKVPVIMLHGNHEEASRLRKACAKFPNITFLHKEGVVKEGFTFIAYGGGGFSERYPELEQMDKSAAWKQVDWARTVFLSHAPPYNTKLDDVGEKGEAWHVGSKTLRNIIKKRKPLLLLAGHIHECFHAKDMIGNTLCENPGPGGTLYDLDKLAKKRK